MISNISIVTDSLGIDNQCKQYSKNQYQWHKFTELSGHIIPNFYKDIIYFKKLEMCHGVIKAYCSVLSCKTQGMLIHGFSGNFFKYTFVHLW